MRIADDRADHRGGRETDRVGEQPVDEARLLRLRDGAADRIVDVFRVMRVARPVIAPELQERLPESGPEGGDLVEQPSLLRAAAAELGRVAVLRVIADQQMADEDAEVDADRPEGRELRIDDPHVVVRQHHRAGVEIVVDQRLRRREVLAAEAPGRGAYPAVRAEILDERVEMRRRPMVPHARHERILIDELEHDPVQDVIGLQLGDPLVLELLLLMEIGGEEGRARHELGDAPRHAGIDLAGDDPAAQNLMGRKLLHGDQRKLRVVVEDLRS